MATKKAAAKGGTGIQKVTPKKDTMAKNIGDHMGPGRMKDADPQSERKVRKTGGRSK